MPRGVPKNGFRMTKRRLAQGGRVAPPLAAKLAVPVKVETVQEIEQKLTDRFEALEIMTDATGSGINRSLIVSGPAGLGKSFTVETKMEALEKAGRHVTYVKGYVRPLSLYKLLWEARSEGSIIVFDDSDSVFYDDVSMNLLKAACDSTETRRLYWLSKSLDNVNDDEGESIPDRFVFEGSIIFITNYDFDNMIQSGNKLAPHFEALVSRSMYLDLEMKTKMDYIVRIKQVVRKGMLAKRGFKPSEITQIVDFIEANMDLLRELSLRMVLKISTLYRMDKMNWQKLVKQTCFRNAK